jgi:hypothetical protein
MLYAAPTLSIVLNTYVGIVSILPVRGLAMSVVK